MKVILDGCPFFEEVTQVETPSGPVVVRPYQIVAWVSLALRGKLSPRFPVILDSGHSHNFSISEEQVRLWTGFEAKDMQTIGYAKLNKRIVELKRVAVAVYPNIRDTRNIRTDESPYLMALPEGIALHRAGDPLAPRLPLLGVRALVKNRLRLTIDGDNRTVLLVRPESTA
jgi:hypothetical protein